MRTRIRAGGFSIEIFVPPGGFHHIERRIPHPRKEMRFFTHEWETWKLSWFRSSIEWDSVVFALRSPRSFHLLFYAYSCSRSSPGETLDVGVFRVYTAPFP